MRYLRVRLTRRAFGLSALASASFRHPAHAALSHEVLIEDENFRPRRLMADLGDTVVFVNRTAQIRSVTANAGSFETGPLAPGQSATVTITAKGRIRYFCDQVPEMRGVIDVD